MSLCVTSLSHWIATSQCFKIHKWVMYRHDVCCRTRRENGLSVVARSLTVST